MRPFYRRAIPVAFGPKSRAWAHSHEEALSDPLDIAAAMQLSRATVRKMKQNLVWASVYNVMAIPIAAGVLFPATGIELRPEWWALLMSASSIIVATNAVLLKRVERALPEQPALGA
jgi:hypothetical protein